MTTWQIRERGLGGDKAELESYIDTLVEQFVKYYSYPKGSEQYIGIAAHVCKFLVEQGVDISPLGKKGAGLMMAKWQIRQHVTNEVLKEFDVEIIEFSPSLGLAIRPPFEYFNFDSNVHYICKAGEVLVSEEEHKLLQNERDVFLGSLESVSKENDELQARIAELEQQLEAKKEPKFPPLDMSTIGNNVKVPLEPEAKKESKPLGCDHSSFEGSCIRAEHELMERSKARKEAFDVARKVTELNIEKMHMLMSSRDIDVVRLLEIEHELFNLINNVKG